MRPYDKIFFVCTSNTLLSPIAEGIYRSEAAVYMPEPYSRGLVVLFEEPISPNVNLLLSKHEMTPGNHSQSMQLQKEELTDKTLILTMTFPEKVQFLETYGDGYAVYTLGEFAGVETDVSDPYGAEEEAYEKCFEEIEERIRLTIHRLEEEEKDDSIG